MPGLVVTRFQSKRSGYPSVFLCNKNKYHASRIPFFHAVRRSLFIFFLCLMGLFVTWPTIEAQARLDRAQLRSLVAGLKSLHEQLVYQRSQLNPDIDTTSFCTPRHALSRPEEARLALESFLLITVADDRDMLEGLIFAIKQLDSDWDYYIRTKAPKGLPIRPEGVEVATGGIKYEMSDFYSQFLANNPEADHLNPKEISDNALVIQSVIQSTCGGVCMLRFMTDYSSMMKCLDQRDADRKKIWWCWAALDLEYQVTLDKIDEVRGYFLNQLGDGL